MAKYTVKCPQCGEGRQENLIGKHKHREWRLENWDWTCINCSKANRDKANSDSAEKNMRDGLPPLIGSAKQIAWAETIRMRKISSMIEDIAKMPNLDSSRLSATIDAIKNQNSASWWIDRRDSSVDYIVSEIYKITDAPISDSDTYPNAEAEAMAEATIRPSAPITETVAEIKILSDSVNIIFNERREDFRTIVKSLGYKWDSGKWTKKMGLMSGSPEERAVELGCKLLQSHFCIRIYNQEIREKCLKGEYTSEPTKYIMALVKGQYAGWFSIQWGKDEDFYSESRKITGSKYKKGVIVPPEHFEEVIDFAEINGFCFSDGAKKIIHSAEETKNKAVLLSDVFNATDTSPHKSKEAEQPNQEKYEILDEFRE